MKTIQSWCILILAISACTSEALEKPLTKIAFGSCAKQWLPQPIWKSIGNENSDLFIFLGDAIYGDWNDTNVFEVTSETLDRDYKKLAAIPEFKKFRESTPIIATWDNHDYGVSSWSRP